jgi:hypothetical protein
MMNIRVVSTGMLRHLGAAEEAGPRDSTSAFRRLILFENLAAKAGIRSRPGWHTAFRGRGQGLETMSYLALWLCAWMTVLLCVL